MKNLMEAIAGDYRRAQKGSEGLLKHYGWTKTKSSDKTHTYTHPDRPGEELTVLRPGGSPGSNNMWYHTEGEYSPSSKKIGFGRGTYWLDRHLMNLHGKGSE